MQPFNCPRCDGLNQPGAHFCQACGLQLMQPPPIQRTQGFEKKGSTILYVILGILILLIIVAVSSSRRNSETGSSTSTAPVAPPPAATSPITTNTPSTSYSSNWIYSESKDEMSGKTINFARTTSVNTLNFDFPYQGEQNALLTLRKHPRSGLNIILSIEKGQFLCGLWSCSLNVRFDEGPAQKFSASGPEDQSTTMLFINSEQRFLTSLKKAKTLRIEANFYQSGTRIIEFDVAGIKW